MNCRATSLVALHWGSTMITGTHINYYFICKRKLWLFAQGIGMEHTSDTVYLGKIIDESSYERKDKKIDIDDTIVIDWIDDKTGIIHEVKKSDKMEEAHTWQVLYYLWYLKRKGVTVADSQMAEYQNGRWGGLKGEIDYPALKQRVEVVLTTEKEERLNDIIADIERIIRLEKPPERIHKKFCKTCSYYELCWVGG